MGKMLESIGIIEGYDIVSIGKLKAKKDSIFKEIEKYDSKVTKEARKIIQESSGIVFAIVKKGIIKGIYLFKTELNKDEKVLRLIKKIYVNEVKKDIRDKYDEIILEHATEAIKLQEYSKIILNDTIIQVNPKLTKKERNLALLSGFTLGFMCGWLIFDEFYLGVIYGIIFAPIFSGLEVIITNKRGRKNNKDSN